MAGLAHVDDAVTVRDVVYTRTPEVERNLDALQAGVAVVVDLVRIEGASPAGRFRMERDAG
jgi:hypothetical protein